MPTTLRVKYLTRDQMEERRLEGVAMLTSGVSQSKVSKELLVSRTTVSRWNKAIQRGESLVRRKATGRPAALDGEDWESIRALRDSGVSPKSLAGIIKERYGILYTQAHISHKLLKMRRATL